MVNKEPIQVHQKLNISATEAKQRILVARDTKEEAEQNTQAAIMNIQALEVILEVHRVAKLITQAAKVSFNIFASVFKGMGD